MPNPKRKSDFSRGLEFLLNTPSMNPISNPNGFRDMSRNSEMPISEMLKYVGNKSRKPRGPTDSERSEKRLEKLESAQSQ